MSKKDINQDSNLEGVESALTRTEQFIEDNQKSLTYIVGVIVLIVAAYLGAQKFYIAPLEEEARSSMFVAEQYFQKDSFNLAIDGDGNNWGFIDIMNDYKFTKSANLAKYYTGISYLHLGEYEEAISYLKKFKSSDIMVGTIAIGAIGDAYAEMEEFKKAISQYEKAAKNKSNDFTTPIFLIKAAQLHEELGNYKKAISLYETIKADYPKSQEGKSADKYITKAKLEIEK